jgi:hypothetical protein
MILYYQPPFLSFTTTKLRPMQADQMQRQRFELKYHIDEPTAHQVRAMVAQRLELDPFGVGQPQNSYPIHSLYLDSPDLNLYHSTINGDRNRFKLRARFYDDDPSKPVFLETKRRVNDCILKERAIVHRDRFAPMLQQSWPSPSDLVNHTAEQLTAARNFCQRIDQLRAMPISHVSYRREAWFAPGHNSVRVTIDRDIVCEPCNTYTTATELQNPTAVFQPGEVILEIKFTERFPEWLGDMVRSLDLIRTSAAKYVDGVTHADVRNFTPPQFSPV